MLNKAAVQCLGSKALGPRCGIQDLDLDPVNLKPCYKAKSANGCGDSTEINKMRPQAFPIAYLHVDFWWLQKGARIPGPFLAPFFTLSE